MLRNYRDWRKQKELKRKKRRETAQQTVTEWRPWALLNRVSPTDHRDQEQNNGG